eukprot:439003_1
MKTRTLIRCIICITSIQLVTSIWTEYASRLPYTTYAGAGGFYNGTIFLLGGFHPERQLVQYNVATGQVNEIGLNILTKDYYGWGQTFTQNDDTLYLLSDESGGIDSYNLKALKNGDYSRTYLPLQSGSGDHYACLASSAEHLYVLGGTTNGKNLVQGYDIQGQYWLSNVPPLLNPRSYFPCLTHNNILYAIGGMAAVGKTKYRSIEQIDVSNISQHQWSYFPGELSSRISSSRAVAVHDKIYILGGNSEDHLPSLLLDLVHIMDTQTGTVTVSSDRLTERQTNTVPIFVGTTLYAFGGNQDASVGQKIMYYNGPYPTAAPTEFTPSPSAYPSSIPTVPTLNPSLSPSQSSPPPTRMPSTTPTTANPSAAPTMMPSTTPTTANPSAAPTMMPTQPTAAPIANPTTETGQPTKVPTLQTSDPTVATSDPTIATNDPTVETSAPTTATANPTIETDQPTKYPTTATHDPTTATENPTTDTANPTTATHDPTTATENPTTDTANPTETANPTVETGAPTAGTNHPTQDSFSPTSYPSSFPTFSTDTAHSTDAISLSKEQDNIASDVTIITGILLGVAAIAIAVLVIVHRVRKAKNERAEGDIDMIEDIEKADVNESWKEKNVATWDANDVYNWICSLDSEFEEMAAVLRLNHIRGRALGVISQAQMNELGIALGDRLELENAIKKLFAQGESDPDIEEEAPRNDQEHGMTKSIITLRQEQPVGDTKDDAEGKMVLVTDPETTEGAVADTGAHDDV